MYEKIKEKYIVKDHKVVIRDHLCKVRFEIEFAKGQVWELESHLSKEFPFSRERYTLRRDNVTISLSEDEFKNLFAPYEEKLPKCTYQITISKADIEKALETYKEEGYKKRYIDLFHFDIVLRYLSHCKGPLYSTTEILAEDEMKRVMDNDWAIAIQKPAQIVLSFNEVLDYIGLIGMNKE